MRAETTRAGNGERAVRGRMERCAAMARRRIERDAGMFAEVLR